MLLQRTQFGSPGPRLDGSQPPETPAPGDIMPSSGLWEPECPYSHVYTHTQTYIIKKKGEKIQPIAFALK